MPSLNSASSMRQLPETFSQSKFLGFFGSLQDTLEAKTCLWAFSQGSNESHPEAILRLSKSSTFILLFKSGEDQFEISKCSLQ